MPDPAKDRRRRLRFVSKGSTPDPASAPPPAEAPATRADRTWLVAIFVFALAVRALALFVVLPNAGRIVPGLHSSVGMSFDGYEAIARQLVAKQRFSLDAASGPTAARAPLYPLLLAAHYRVFGPGVTPVLWTHALLGALTCALVFLVGRRMFGRAVGATAGLLFAVFPPHLWWSQYILSEPLLVTLVTATFLGVLRFVERPSAGRAAAAGALFGATALCNAMILFLPFVLIVAAALAPGRWRATVRYAVPLLLAMAVVVLPWTARNFLVFRRVIPINWSIGLQYLKGLIMADDYASGRGRDLGVLDDSSMVAVLRILRENGYARGEFDAQLHAFRSSQTVGLAEDDLLKRLAMERVRERPSLVVRKLVMNLPLYWFLSNRMMRANQVVYFGLLALASLGLALGAWRAPGTRVLVAFCLYFWLGYSMVLVSARFALQIAPLLTVLAAYGIVALGRGARRTAGPSLGS